MSIKRRVTMYSVRSSLLGMLIGKRARGKAYLQLWTRQLLDRSFLFRPCCPTFSFRYVKRQVARALNNLVGEGRALFGSSDSHALSEFVAEYLCGDDPLDSDGQ